MLLYWLFIWADLITSMHDFNLLRPLAQYSWNWKIISPSPKCYMTFWDMTIYNDTLNWQDITQICELITELDCITDFDLITNFGGFHRTLQRVRLANRGRLLLWTPGPVPFGTCIYSNVETILSWTCHVCGPFEFRTSLGTFILLLKIECITVTQNWV